MYEYIYDLHLLPKEFSNPYDHLRSLGMQWESSEANPISDSVKFKGCASVPKPLPAALRKVR